MKKCNKSNYDNEDNSNFCGSCGTKIIISDNNQKKDIFNVLSIISLILFIIIILANIIVYPLSLTGDESSGMFWFFLVLIPSVLLYFPIILFLIIAIINYFKNRKNDKISKKRKFLTLVNGVQLILMIIIFGFILNYMFNDKPSELESNGDNPVIVEPDDNEFLCDYKAEVKEPNYDWIGNPDESFNLDLSSDCEQFNINIDELIKLVFNRNESDDTYPLSRYFDVNIYINNNLVYTDLFNDVYIDENTFSVYKHNELYFFTNYLAAQCGGADTLIIDKSGEILKTISGFTYSLNTESTFTVHDYGNCFEINDDKDLTYEIKDNTIKENN